MENGTFPIRSSNHVLVIGGGGREHAITYSLLKSPFVRRVSVCPGNFGTHLLAKECEKNQNAAQCANVALAAEDLAGIVRFARQQQVALVVVGPEQPLVDGLADMLRAEHIACFGPSALAAQLEGSKAWSKQFMTRHGLPTAAFRCFSAFPEAEEYILALPHDVVVKASGLAGGKGVVLPSSQSEAVRAVRSLLQEDRLGGAGREVVVEALLTGPEVSLLAFCDGRKAVGMPAAQDHKRVRDGDLGPNTGGMGAYAPTPLISPEQYTRCMAIVQQTVDGMAQEGMPYEGVLYAGFMLTPDGPYLLEFNCRFGDPETQVLLPLLADESDLFLIMLACSHHSLPVSAAGECSLVKWTKGAVACTVVVASEGYPGTYPTGVEVQLQGLQGSEKSAESVYVYHAGTAASADGERCVTSGGRVLAVTGVGKGLRAAVKAAYRGVASVSFQGMHFRRDIAHRGLARPLRLGVLGSTRGTDLQAIIDAIEAGELPAQVGVVLSDRAGAGILQRAARHGLPCQSFSAAGLTREAFDRLLTRRLEQAGVDLVLMIGYMRIASEEFVGRWRGRCLNVHPSLLPKFAGGMDLQVHEAVIAAGERESGCSIHWVTEQLDGGPVLLARTCEVRPGDTPEALKQRVQGLEGEAFVEAIRLLHGSLVLEEEEGKAQPLTYKSAGVDIDAGEELVTRIKPHCKRTRRPGCDAELGGFGGLFDLSQAGFGGDDTVLVAGTDGVGTKLVIAQAVGRHGSIGVDLVAMCVNDILVCGAEPLFFLDYYATGRLDVEAAAQVVQGIAEGCLQAGAALIGGETAEMAGLYAAGEYDLAGFSVGAVRRSGLLPRGVCEGDVLLGLASSGVHSNGYSLVRKCVERAGLKWTDPCPFEADVTVAEALLRPTRIYVKQLLPLIRRGLVKGLAHITGGGLLDNLPRMLPDDLAALVDVEAAGWTLPAVFAWLQRVAGLSQQELLRTFNCGVGMVLAVDGDRLGQVLGELRAAGEEPLMLGVLGRRQGEQAQVVVTGLLR